MNLPMKGTKLRSELDAAVKREREAILGTPAAMRDIVLTVATETGVPARSILADTQTKAVAAARQLAMARCMRQGLTSGVVGLFFNRDPSTVRRMVSKCEAP